MTPPPALIDFSEAPASTGGERAGVVWEDTGRWTAGSRMARSTTSPGLATAARETPKLAFARLMSGGSPATGEQNGFFTKASDPQYKAVAKLSAGALLAAVLDLAPSDDEDARFRNIELIASSLLAPLVEEGNIEDAYRFASLLVERDPTSAAAKRWAEVLHPPTFATLSEHASLADAGSIKSNNAWLKEHASAYEGQWVALLDGELLGHAKRLKDLRAEHDIPVEALLTRLVS